MTAPSIASATVVVTPTIDSEALSTGIRAAVAAELRRLADELYVEEVTAPEPPRFELIVDKAGDYGVRDNLTGLVFDSGDSDREEAFEAYDELVGGAPVAGYDFEKASYLPHSVVAR